VANPMPSTNRPLQEEKIDTVLRQRLQRLNKRRATCVTEEQLKKASSAPTSQPSVAEWMEKLLGSKKT